MDLPWGEDRTKQFATNVGLITSNGPNGNDIMACEWTFHVSYSPGLIAVCIHRPDATHENIEKTKEFGVNLAASDQNTLSSISGGYHGTQYNKVEALKELGYKFFKAKKIDVMMVEGAAMNAECRPYYVCRGSCRTLSGRKETNCLSCRKILEAGKPNTKTYSGRKR